MWECKRPGCGWVGREPVNHGSGVLIACCPKCRASEVLQVQTEGLTFAQAVEAMESGVQIQRAPWDKGWSLGYNKLGWLTFFIYGQDAGKPNLTRTDLNAND